jgi:hypothetical protein
MYILGYTVQPESKQSMTVMCSFGITASDPMPPHFHARLQWSGVCIRDLDPRVQAGLLLLRCLTSTSVLQSGQSVIEDLHHCM